MAQFKVGDLVKVNKSEYGRKNSWWDDVDENKVYKIIGAKQETDGYALDRLPLYLFESNWLMPAFKFQIGENVKVGDAIGRIQNQYRSDSENCYLVRFENTRYEPVATIISTYAICYRESQIEKYEPVLPVEEVKEEKTKKRKPLEVFAKLNKYFNWFWTVEGLSLFVGIRNEGSDDDYTKKEFEYQKVNKAYKWLVKQACEMCDTFAEWYNG